MVAVTNVDRVIPTVATRLETSPVATQTTIVPVFRHLVELVIGADHREDAIGKQAMELGITALALPPSPDVSLTILLAKQGLIAALVVQILGYNISLRLLVKLQSHFWCKAAEPGLLAFGTSQTIIGGFQISRTLITLSRLLTF
jgi:hypothetical protein